MKTKHILILSLIFLYCSCSNSTQPESIEKQISSIFEHHFSSNQNYLDIEENKNN